ncbi:uncharacterized protein [Diadema antillarum]|uniref:uncharacterized protein n=1 Tax=Diadema antillarum TaxID=105358 RepID=UPI003A8A733D
MESFRRVVTYIVLLVFTVCDSVAFSRRRELSHSEAVMLQEYRLQVERKLSSVRASPDFLRIFVTEDELQPTFTAMVNKTVQDKNKGRLFYSGTSIEFSEEISQQAMAAWIAHGKSVPCSEPKPLLLDMFDELNLPRWTGSYIYPKCTWVRRCAESGCCASELQHCASVPGTRVNVTRPFVKVVVTDITASGAVTHRSEFLNYTLYEDTACECRNRPDAEIPCAPRPCPEKQDFSVALCACKCRKRCPHPFVQILETCECTCEPGDRRCLKMRRGKVELQQTQCSCVGHGCEQPECRRNWVFSKTHCRCMERAPPDVDRRARILNGAARVSTAADTDLLGEQASGSLTQSASARTTVSFSTLPPEPMTGTHSPPEEDATDQTDPMAIFGSHLPSSSHKEQDQTHHSEHENNEVFTTATPVNRHTTKELSALITPDSATTSRDDDDERENHHRGSVSPENPEGSTRGMFGSRDPWTEDEWRRHHHTTVGFEDDEDEDAMTPQDDDDDELGSGSVTTE